MIKPSRCTVAVAAFVLCVGLGLWTVRREREPVFEGKPLSYWLHEYSATMVAGAIPRTEPDLAARNEKAVKAVRVIGTNAIPSLLKMLRAKDSTFIRKLHDWARIVKISNDSASDRNDAGADGFVILGAAAQNAVPRIAEIFEENISPSSVVAAASALCAIGPSASAAVPSLLRGATNSDPVVRLNAISPLRRITASPEEAIPVLIMALSDTDFRVQSIAFRDLGEAGAKAVEAVPVLVHLATNADVRLRRSASGTLGRICSAPEMAVPTLVLCLEDQDTSVRKLSALSLGNFGEQAKQAAPELTRLLHDKEPEVREAAKNALKKIGYPSYD